LQEACTLYPRRVSLYFYLVGQYGVVMPTAKEALKIAVIAILAIMLVKKVSFLDSIVGI
jgi:hypothetical protein